jgi:acyl carrier protein
MSDNRWLRPWLEGVLAKELNLSLDEVRRVKRFDEMGVDSILAVFIAAELEEKLQKPVSTSALYDHPDLDSLVAALC